MQKQDPLNPTTASIYRNSDPRFHVTKVEKQTGQPIPQWKEQLLVTKAKKQIEKEASNTKDSEIANDVPVWKREVLMKKEKRLMASDDPLEIRKRRMRSLKQQCNSGELPDWKKELLNKKVQQIENEICELEMKDAKRQ
eukprot:gene15169-16728_t